MNTPDVDIRSTTDRSEVPGPARSGVPTERPPLTKIIATIGPASSDADTLAKLIDAGVTVFRLNFSHGTLDEHAPRVRAIHDAAVRAGRPVAILGDLPGPKIRVGRVAGQGVDVPTGSIVIFQRQPIEATDAAAGDVRRFSSTYEQLVDDVAPGQRLLIADGAVRMLIVAKEPDAIRCTVTHGGTISTGKGVNLPDSDLRVPAMTGRDLECVRWAIDNDIDMLALSFVRRAADVSELHAEIAQYAARTGRSGMRMPIIAKIEHPMAVGNIESIIEVCDGIMVARGDLGVEMDLAEVPVVQRRLIDAAQRFGKPSIVATQMLESMIDSPVPTRAEANDVANAIFDQADAVMLSGETAVGAFPVVAVEHMRRIASHTEAYLATLPRQPSPPGRLVEQQYRTAALAHGVWVVAHDFGAKLIVVWSQQGGGARYLSQNNFHMPIVAATSNERAARQMQLLRGVWPVCVAVPEGLAHFTRQMDAYLLESDLADRGDKCVLVAGAPLGQAGVTNSLAMHRVGHEDTGFSTHER